MWEFHVLACMMCGSGMYFCCHCAMCLPSRMRLYMIDVSLEGCGCHCAVWLEYLYLHDAWRSVGARMPSGQSQLTSK
jgi:hypothetical protein